MASPNIAPVHSHCSDAHVFIINVDEIACEFLSYPPHSDVQANSKIEENRAWYGMFSVVLKSQIASSLYRFMAKSAVSYEISSQEKMNRSIQGKGLPVCSNAHKNREVSTKSGNAASVGSKKPPRYPKPPKYPSDPAKPKLQRSTAENNAIHRRKTASKKEQRASGSALSTILSLFLTIFLCTLVILQDVGWSNHNSNAADNNTNLTNVSYLNAGLVQNYPKAGNEVLSRLATVEGKSQRTL